MKKILIVEDDELLLGVLSSQFEEHGYEVITAVDGIDGFDKFKSLHPDVIIADIVMPKKTGLEMLEMIHHTFPEDTTPVVVLTNTNEMDAMAEALSQKVVAYLLKSSQELENVVEVVEKKIGK